MKKSFLLLLCLILVALTVLVACDGHEHTFSDVWSFDETNHWHKGTCEHADATAAVGAHVDADNDKVCDICFYDYNHTHAYATDWSTDANYHWHVSTCGCEYVADKGAHIDVENDGVCDVCGIGSEHTHTFAEDWSFNADSHWHVAICGHGAKELEGAHELDKAGICTVCSYGSEKLSVEAAIEYAIENKNLVNKGVYHHSADYGTGFVNSSVVSYEFGENVFYYIEEDEYSSIPYWYSLIDGEKVLGVYEVDECPYAAYEPSIYNLDGYAIYIFDEIYYGAEDIVSGLYDFVIADENGDAWTLMTNVDGKLVYSYGFGYFNGETFTEITVSFTLSENYAIDTLEVTVDEFSYVYDYDFDEYYYGYVMNEDETYSALWLNPGTTRLYSFTQTEGEKNVENKYDPNVVLAKDFQLVDGAEQNLPATGNNVNAGVDYSYLIGAITPNTIIEDINSVIYTVLIDGEEAYEYEHYSCDGYGTYFAIKFLTAGDFTVVLTYGNATKTYEFTVVIPDATNIGVFQNGESFTEANTYVGSALEFTVMDVENALADCGDYTVTCPSQNVTITTEAGVTKFVASVSGTYIVTVTAKNDVKCVFMVTVEDAPDLSEIINGEYEISFYGSNIADVVFTPATEGALNGIVVITSENPYFENAGEFRYTYDTATGILTLVNVDDETDSRTDAIYVVNYELCTIFFGSEYVLTRPAKGITEDHFVDKTYTNGTWYVTFTTYGDGVYFFNIMDVPMGRPSNAASFFYTVSEGFMVYVFSVEENGEAMGTVPVIIEMYYDQDSDEVVIVTEGYQEIHLSLYNPYA